MSTSLDRLHREKAQLPQPSAAYAFFLDVDGTLIGLRERPDQVACPPEVRSLLGGLRKAADGALALVSGRRIETLDEIFSPLRLPTAGLHGAERRDAGGRIHRLHPDPQVLSRVHRAVAEVAHAHPGVLLEDKGVSLALHYRALPEAGEAVRKALEAFVASVPEYSLKPGKMVWELRPADCDKGRAVQAFLAEAPFANRRPVFAGDDVTDEDGFQFVNGRNGYSIRVGAGETVARFRVADRDGILEWLGSCAAQGSMEAGEDVAR